MKISHVLSILVLLLAACDNTVECYETNHPREYFDFCATYPGTPQYKQSHPASCPWPEENNRCYPPSGSYKE